MALGKAKYLFVLSLLLGQCVLVHHQSNTGIAGFQCFQLGFVHDALQRYMHEFEEDDDDQFNLFLNFIGSIHKPLTSDMLPHRFEIDWVRCYTKK